MAHADSAFFGELGLGEPGEARWREQTVQAFPGSGTSERWLADWQKRWVKEYYKSLNHRPDQNLLRSDAFLMPAGWEMLLLKDNGL